MNAQTIKQFRETASRASCLASLATAARLVAAGSSLGDQFEQNSVAADILEAIKLLSVDLAEANDKRADAVENIRAETPRAAAPHQAASFEMPGVWYDLSGRVSAAQSLTSCAQEALPSGLKGLVYERMNHASNLLAALEDILKLMEQDVNLIEAQLKS